MDDWIFSIPNILQSVLDTIVSTRSSVARRTRALLELEHLVAKIFTGSDADAVDVFCSLQDSFECNVPSRLLFWMSGATVRLESLLNRGHEKQAELTALCSQLMQCLTITQGVVLSHQSSKVFMGRKYPLEILLDLLLVARHIPVSSDSDAISRSSTSSTPPSASSSSNIPLASVVLDTLLCILVDAPAALRTFEDVNGVQVAVKLLKRPHTPKEVKMKCLEFFYFYLMDETSASNNMTRMPTPAPPSAPPTSPSAAPNPLLPSPSLSESRQKPRYTGHVPREESSGSDDSYTSGTSRSSTSSTTSASSISSSATTLVPPSPTSTPLPKTPPHSPPDTLNSGSKRSPSSFSSSGPSAKPRSLLMLRKDVDFVPLSPKKGSPLTRLGVGHSRLSSITNINTTPMSTPRRQKPLSAGTSSEKEDGDSGNSTFALTYDENSSVDGSEPDLNSSSNSCATSSVPRREYRQQDGNGNGNGNVSTIRTTEEKKKLLGTMLGNVDALVEGVRKAGVWGLG